MHLKRTNYLLIVFDDLLKEKLIRKSLLINVV